jgi:hypothetical protein
MVAAVPLDRAFALLKSARVSTVGATRARYHSTPRRVLFKASSVDLSQDARVPRVKEKVIAIVAKRQSTNGAEQWQSSETKPICTRRSAFRAPHTITSGMTDEAGKKSTAVERCFQGRETANPDCVLDRQQMLGAPFKPLA